MWGLPLYGPKGNQPTDFPRKQLQPGACHSQQPSPPTLHHVDPFQCQAWYGFDPHGVILIPVQDELRQNFFHGNNCYHIIKELFFSSQLVCFSSFSSSGLSLHELHAIQQGMRVSIALHMTANLCKLGSSQADIALPVCLTFFRYLVSSSWLGSNGLPCFFK